MHLMLEKLYNNSRRSEKKHFFIFLFMKFCKIYEFFLQKKRNEKNRKLYKNIFYKNKKLKKKQIKFVSKKKIPKILIRIFFLRKTFG